MDCNFAVLQDVLVLAGTERDFFY